jgi:Zn-finger nucleic acid-binding protein
MKGTIDMKCPVCKTPDLLMSEREGIEIDYCATCRGVWLDRGELDKLLARVEENALAESRRHAPRERGDYAERERRAEWGTRDEAYDGHRDRRHTHRKKKSLLGELFDFG